MMVEEEKSLDVHVMISQVLVPLQMRLPSPMPLFYVNIHALSYTVIFDIDNEVRHFINHHRMAIMIPGSCWLDRNTIQQWGPGYVCCTLSQSSLMSDWFTNRSQIWMIIIRYRRTCPALLIWQIWKLVIDKDEHWDRQYCRAGWSSTLPMYTTACLQQQQDS